MRGADEDAGELVFSMPEGNPICLNVNLHAFGACLEWVRAAKPRCGQPKFSLQVRRRSLAHLGQPVLAALLRIKGKIKWNKGPCKDDVACLSEQARRMAAQELDVGWDVMRRSSASVPKKLKAGLVRCPVAGHEVIAACQAKERLTRKPFEAWMCRPEKSGHGLRRPGKSSASLVVVRTSEKMAQMAWGNTKPRRDFLLRQTSCKQLESLVQTLLIDG